MGIQTEYNPDLALRHFKEYRSGRRKEECLPERIEVNQIYDFLKKGQRNYWIEGEIPLLETKGDQKLSRPLASIVILEATHFLLDKEPYTRGKYQVIELIEENQIKFNGFAKIN